MRVLDKLMAASLMLLSFSSLAEEAGSGWLEKMQHRLPAFICSQSPPLMQCLRWDWPDCIDATAPAVRACMSRIGPPSGGEELDEEARKKYGAILIRCAIADIFQDAKMIQAWEPGCENVANLAEVEPRIDVVFFQNGAIKIPRKGRVSLSNSPFVIHVSSRKGTPGIFATRLEQPFPAVNWSNPHFLAPVREQACPADTLCPTDLPFAVQSASTFLGQERARLSKGAAEELHQIDLTYGSLAQVVSVEINIKNFSKTRHPGSFEYRVTDTSALITRRGGSSEKIWLVVTMNDQPRKSFPYARARAILIELDKSYRMSQETFPMPASGRERLAAR